MTAAREDSLLVAQSAREVLSREFDSRALHRFFDGGEEEETALWALAADMGWLGVAVPERLGGLGLGPFACACLLKEFGRAAMPGSLSSAVVAGMLIPFVEEAPAADALGEGLQSGALRPVLPGMIWDNHLEVDDGRITGVLEGALGGRTSNTAIVPITEKGRAAYAIVRIDGASAAFSPDKIWDQTRAIGSLTCEAAEIAGILIPSNRAPADLLATLMRVALAADCIGGCEIAVERTVAYTREREQFGRPVGSFQALKHRMADMRVALDVPEHLFRHASDLVEAADPEAPTWAALAKARNAETYLEIAEEELLLHGGVGFTWDFDCHIRLKRAELTRLLGGGHTASADYAFQRLLTVAGKTAEEAHA